MNAIRADEELGNLHSLYVDQWDWERVISEENRNVEFLKKIDIFVQRFVYEEKPAKIAKRFSVERSYVDNVKSNGIRRFKNYVLATCKAS